MAIIYQITLSIFLLLIPSVALSETSLGETIDCTEVSVDFLDDLNLTREERIMLMDKAFFESLNKFELCQAAKAMTASTSSSAGGGAAGSAGGGSSAEQSGEAGDSGDLASQGQSDAEGLGLEGGFESVATGSMSGTEPKESAEEYASDSEDGLDPSVAELPQPLGGQGRQDGGPQAGSNTNGSLGNGSVPKDIPSAKNDDALAAQIRYAAENEPDPQKKARLWNEYRKYKGLPQK